ncbi:MAG: tetratricopeptide repeat protein [bacterium]|nr:tetratricopeptide repeat protein [bacterium]
MTRACRAGRAVSLAALCLLAAAAPAAGAEERGAMPPEAVTPLAPERIELIPAGSPAAAPSGAGREADPRELFARANSRYEAGDYEAARAAYMELVDRGYRGANLSYNLGNALFKLDRKGEAILHYRKALALRPRDADARSNLDYALSLTRDRIEPAPRARLARFIEAAVSRATLAELAGAAVAAYWLLAALLIVTIYIPSWRPFLGRARTGLAAVLVVAAAAAVLRARLDAREEAVILEPEAKIRYGPSGDDVVAFILHEGAVVRVRNRRDGWLQVALPDGKAGWVEGERCGLI